jgi:hypothetical protein
VAALSTRTPVYVADLSRLGDGLLPAAADAASVSSALCLGLSVKRSGAWQSVGVMSLYGPDCDAFCKADREIAGVFAAFAAAMIDLAQTRRDLRLRSAADGGFWDTPGQCVQVSGSRLAFRRLKP